MGEPLDAGVPRHDPRQPHPKLDSPKSPTVSHTGAAAVRTAQIDLQSRIKEYFDKAAGTYKVSGKEVRVAPFFRMNGGFTERGLSVDGFKQLVEAAADRHDKAFLIAVNMCAYGKGTPEDVQKVTQALIDKGQLDEVRTKYERIPEATFKERYGNVSNHPLSDENAIKLLQWDYGVGTDCSGYVEPAFLAAHSGKAKDYGLDERDNLFNLRDNKKFDRELTPVHARPGDLIILNDGSNPGHTVLVYDRTELSRSKLDPKDPNHLPGIDSFAQPDHKVHTIEVDASWGASYGNLENGGVQRRTLLYDETTGKWADVDKGTVVPQSVGPYHGHTVEGVYHPKH
jgi:hypothetical protein